MNTDKSLPHSTEPATSGNRLPAIGDFSSAAEAVVRFLNDRVGFSLWAVTRMEGNDWIVLSALDRHYGVKAGDVLPWQDSLCARMVAGNGPHVAPAADAIDVFRDAPVSRSIPIGAYIGMPLRRQDGSLFGTLCALDPLPQPERILQEQPLFELLAGLLSTVLNAELAATDAARRAEHAEAETLRDALTALYGRKGWDRSLQAEEDRCRRYGHPACVIIADLDDLKKVNDGQGHQAGDALIVKAARAAQRAARSTDVVARLGGDEFAILGIECDATGAERLMERLRKEFADAGVAASLGMALRRPETGLLHAVNEADKAMYREKKGRRHGRRQSC